MILRLIRSCLRRVLNLSFLAALSLLLCIGLGCVRERSMRVYDQLSYTRSSGQAMMVGTLPQRFRFVVCVSWRAPGDLSSGWHYKSSQWDPQEPFSYLATMWKASWLGFKLIRDDYLQMGGGWPCFEVRIPLWFPMLLTLIAPLCWLRRWRRQARRVRLGLCLHGGYDLRATPSPTGPSLPRCPECGRLDNET